MPFVNAIFMSVNENSNFFFFLTGLKDSIQIPISLFVIYGSNTISRKYMKSLFNSLVLSILICFISISFNSNSSSNLSSEHSSEEGKNLASEENWNLASDENWNLVIQLGLRLRRGLWNYKNSCECGTRNAFSGCCWSSISWSSISLSSSIFMYSCFIINQSLFSEISQRSFEIFTGIPPTIKKKLSIGR